MLALALLLLALADVAALHCSRPLGQRAQTISHGHLHSPSHHISSSSHRHSQRHSRLYASFKGYQQPVTKEGAFHSAKDLHALPAIILVNPYLDQNVGSVARSMLNFGLTELRVVDPRCDILSPDARALAAGAYEILENAKVYATLEECLRDLQRVMATTIRPRHMTQRIYSPSKAAQEALPYLRKPRSSSGSSLSADSAGETGSVEVEAEAEAETEIEIETGTEAETEAEGEGLRVGILFGRERSGLTNEEVALADSIISIPTFKQFSSLNLAQAVNIVGYELWKRQTELMEAEAPAEWLHPRDGERLARVSELDNFLGRQEKCMDERGFQPEPQMRQYAFRNIRNIYQRVLVTKQEIDVLQGVLSCLVKPPRTQAQSTEGGLKDTKETNVDGNIAMGTVGNAPVATVPGNVAGTE